MTSSAVVERGVTVAAAAAAAAALSLLLPPSTIELLGLLLLVVMLLMRRRLLREPESTVVCKGHGYYCNLRYRNPGDPPEVPRHVPWLRESLVTEGR